MARCQRALRKGAILLHRGKNRQDRDDALVLSDQMKSPDPHQAMQRVKVGMIGLAAVVLLIALASTILASLSRDQPAGVAAQPDIAANVAAGNETALPNEPLAELGISPSVNAQVAVDDR